MACDASAVVCPRCGYLERLGPQTDIFYPWRLSSRSAVADYVRSLAHEEQEWLLALYVSEDMNLLSVETIATGSVTECPFDMGRIILRGLTQRAAGFFLVHNHPSGDPTPSRPDRQLTLKLARISRDLDMPLIEHFVVGSNGMAAVLLE